MKFRLGSIYATPGALELLEGVGQLSLTFLTRHAQGDWGAVPPEDARQNVIAVRSGLRILSSYPLAGGCLWIITEADRSSTTLLLPSEYEQVPKMADVSHLNTVSVTLTVTVQVDPDDVPLVEMLTVSRGTRSITDVVRAEVESNLESVSYVRHVFTHDRQGVQCDDTVRSER